MMTPENRILALAAEGRIVRNTCPAHLAPQWVAYLMPWWGDAGSAERWPEVVQQVGELAPHLGELTGAKGRRALARCQLVTLRAVVPVAGSSLPVVERGIALWERVLADDEPTSDEWAASTWAAWAAASWAARSLAKSAADTIIFGHLAAIREELGL